MNLYTYIRNKAASAGIEVTDRDVSRIAGTLKVCGFSESLTPSDVIMADSIVDGNLYKIVAKYPSKRKGAKKIKASASPVEAVTNESAFDQIDAQIKQGKCPRCMKATQDVFLKNYEKVKYCESCKVTLW